MLVTDEVDSFVSALAKRVEAARAVGGRTGRRSMYRREIADLLGAPVRRGGVRSRPARLRPGRRAGPVKARPRSECRSMRGGGELYY